MIRESSNISASPGRQLWSFVLHLRLHYQLLILSGPFLLGGLLSEQMSLPSFLLQFCNVHLLLFSGATAFNSYWDKDEGSIGGLKRPPTMESWMRPTSLILQLIGLSFALFSGVMFAFLYAISTLLFWLYSTPFARWKGHPLKSLIAIGISTGFNAVLMGFLAASRTSSLPFAVWIAALGGTLILLSLYPVSQIYQREEDMRHGDQTFVIAYGNEIVLHFYEITFILGLIILSEVLFQEYGVLGLIFGGLGVVAFFAARRSLKSLTLRQNYYTCVMRIKYATSIAFELFLVMALFAKSYGFDGIFSSLDMLF